MEGQPGEDSWRGRILVEPSMLSTKLLTTVDGAGISAYAEMLINNYGADEVWPLVDIASGTTIFAYLNGDRDGTLSGWELQNADGPVSSSLAPKIGVDDWGAISAAGTDSIVDFNEMSVFIWAKAVDSAMWSDGKVRWLMRWEFGSNDYLAIASTGSNTLLFRCRQNNVSKDITVAMTDDGWFSTGLSVSVSANAFKAYRNGVQVGSTVTGLVERAVTLTAVRIGNVSQVAGSTESWRGWLAYLAVRSEAA